MTPVRDEFFPSRSLIIDRYFDTASGLTLWGLARSWADRRPDEVVVVSQPAPGSKHAPERWTWAEFVADTSEFRRRLAAHGVGRGAIVLMALPNSPLALATWLAVPANAAVIQAVDVDSGLIALRRAIAVSDPVLVIAAREVEQKQK